MGKKPNDGLLMNSMQKKMIQFFNYGESMSISHNACEEAQERQKLERGASQVAPGLHARVRIGALGLHLTIQLLVTYTFNTCFMFALS